MNIRKSINVIDETSKYKPCVMEGYYEQAWTYISEDEKQLVREFDNILENLLDWVSIERKTLNESTIDVKKTVLNDEQLQNLFYAISKAGAHKTEFGDLDDYDSSFDNKGGKQQKIEKYIDSKLQKLKTYLNDDIPIKDAGNKIKTKIEDISITAGVKLSQAMDVITSKLTASNIKYYIGVVTLVAMLMRFPAGEKASLMLINKATDIEEKNSNEQVI